MGSDVADVAEDKADEHEEEADQREGCGGADHLWKRNPHQHVFLLTVASQTHQEVVN